MSEVVEMTDEEINEKSEEVMMPTPVEVIFMGHKIPLLPLPLKYSRNLSKLIRPFTVKIAKFESQVKNEDGSEDFQKIMEEFPLDDDATDSLLKASHIILTFYKLHNSISIKDLEESATLTDLYSFVNAQVEVNGKNDFLLQPLRILLQLVKEAAKAI